MGRYRFRRPLEEGQWDYLMRRVQVTGGPGPRKGIVTSIRHSERSWGWPLQARTRWKGMRGSWRRDRERPWLVRR